MKTTEKKRSLTTVEETVVTQCTCDICGEVIEVWDNPSYFSSYIEVSAKVPQHDNTRQVTSYDVCSVCFVNKLAPLLQRSK